LEPQGRRVNRGASKGPTANRPRKIPKKSVLHSGQKKRETILKEPPTGIDESPRVANMDRPWGFFGALTGKDGKKRALCVGGPTKPPGVGVDTGPEADQGGRENAKETPVF